MLSWIFLNSSLQGISEGSANTNRRFLWDLKFVWSLNTNFEIEVLFTPVLSDEYFEYFFFKGDNFCQFVVRFGSPLSPPPPPIFFFNLSFIVFLICPGISVYIWVLSSAFSCALENYPTFVQHLYKENFILILVLVSLCLVFLFTWCFHFAAKRNAVWWGGFVSWNWSSFRF